MRAVLIVLDAVNLRSLQETLQQGQIRLPALDSLGLDRLISPDSNSPCIGHFGLLRRRAVGADSISGHWEIAGVPLAEPFSHAERASETLLEALEKEAGVEFLGNEPYEGGIPQELGMHHLATGKPILLCLPHSGFRIAGHINVLPEPRLAEICRAARRVCDRRRFAKVIGSRFSGGKSGFSVVGEEQEHVMIPPRTVLNALADSGFLVEGVGRVPLLFAGSGITHRHPAENQTQALAVIDRLWGKPHDGMIFASLSDTGGLAAFDQWLGGFLPSVTKDDLFILTTRPGLGEAPVLIKHDASSGPLGTRDSASDVAATLARYFKVPESWGAPLLNFARPQ